MTLTNNEGKAITVSEGCYNDVVKIANTCADAYFIYLKDIEGKTHCIVIPEQSLVTN